LKEDKIKVWLTKTEKDCIHN